MLLCLSAREVSKDDVCQVTSGLTDEEQLFYGCVWASGLGSVGVHCIELVLQCCRCTCNV